MADKSPLDAYLECRTRADIAYQEKDWARAANLYRDGFTWTQAMGMYMVDQLRDCAAEISDQVKRSNKSEESPHA